LSSDDLNAPLGQNNKKKGKSPLARLTALAPQALAGVLALFGLAVVAWGLLGNDPLGGKPVAVVSTTPPQASMAKADSGGDGPHHARYDGPSASATKSTSKKMVPPGSTTVTIIDGSNGKSREVIIPGKGKGKGKGSGTDKGAALNTSVDPKMLEVTRHGPIPKIGPDGARPDTRNAEKRALPAGRKDGGADRSAGRRRN
jgi:hypothetical protein